MTIPDSKGRKRANKNKDIYEQGQAFQRCCRQKVEQDKVKCVQKHNQEQFGIQYITISNDIYRGISRSPGLTYGSRIY